MLVEVARASCLGLEVDLNIELLAELLAALAAHHTLDSQVPFKVGVQATSLGELLRAPHALEGFLACVMPQVLEKVLDSLQGLAATAAFFCLVAALEEPDGLATVH